MPRVSIRGPHCPHILLSPEGGDRKHLRSTPLSLFHPISKLSTSRSSQWRPRSASHRLRKCPSLPHPKQPCRHRAAKAPAVPLRSTAAAARMAIRWFQLDDPAGNSLSPLSPPLQPSRQRQEVNSQAFYTPGSHPHEKTAAPRPAVPLRSTADAAHMAFRWSQPDEPTGNSLSPLTQTPQPSRQRQEVNSQAFYMPGLPLPHPAAPRQWCKTERHQIRRTVHRS